MAGPVRVFISYSSKDRPIVKRLMEDLKQAGVEVWFDHEKLKPGTRNWTAAVVRGIEQATDVIYAASPDAANSVYVGHELAIARDEDKEDHILPFWVRGEKWSRCVPFGYYYTQYIDGRDVGYAAGLAKLLATLGVVNTAPTASPPRDYLADWLKADLKDTAWERAERLLTNLTGTGATPSVAPTPDAPAVAFPQQTPPQKLADSMLRQHVEAKARPYVKPIDTRLGAMGKDKQLIPGTHHNVIVQNIGESAALHIFAVLFPSETYLDPQDWPPDEPPLWGMYWKGQLRGLGLAPDAVRIIRLDEVGGPLVGNLRVAPQYTLYAPAQPSPEQRRAGSAHFYSARLTITCRTDSGARIATVFDLDAGHLTQKYADIWNPILLPTEVEHDLLDLDDEWQQKNPWPDEVQF